MDIRVAILCVLPFCIVSTAMAQSSKKTMHSTGRVMSVAPDSLTIKPGNTSMTFVVDATTKVVGKGVGTKTQALKAANKTPQITDFVEEYDSVTVEYQDMGGGTLHANRVDIRVKGTKKP